MTKTIRKVIEKHPLTKHLAPSNPDQWASDNFTINRKRVSRDPSVLACGLYSNTTGARADLIICDDVEVPNTCDTAEKRKKLRERLAENEFILSTGGVQLYIGTPHSYYSIYNDTPRTEIGETDVFLKNFHRLSIPILNSKGQSAWLERYKEKDIQKILRRTGPVKFESQMLLRPVNVAESRFNLSLLRRYDVDIQTQEIQKSMHLSIGGRRMVSVSAWWDPSFGKAFGDASVIAVVYTDEDGEYWLHNVTYISVVPKEGEDEAALQCQKVCEVAENLFLPSIAVEVNGIGKFLPAILRRELSARKIPCSVVEKSSTKAKSERILEAFDAIMAARALHVHESVYQTRFITEMAEWRPSVLSLHDDGLDAAAGALSLEPVRLKKDHYGNFGRHWMASGTTHTAKSDFEI